MVRAIASLAVDVFFFRKATKNVDDAARDDDASHGRPSVKYTTHGIRRKAS